MKKFQHTPLKYVCRFKSVLMSFALIPCMCYALEPQELVKTTNDCSVYERSEIVKAGLENNIKTEIAWSGDCVNGLAEGAGDLQKTSIFDQKVISISTERTKMRAGNSFGFYKFIYKSAGFNTDSLGFKYNGRFIDFSGLGLEGNDAILANTEASLPQRLSSLGPINSQIWDSGMGRLRFVGTPCAYFKNRFPECEIGGEPARDYQVYFYTFRGSNVPPHQPGTPMFEGDTLTFCPQPRVLSSCTQIAAQLSEPVVRSAENFIKESMPGVRTMEDEMRRVLAARDQEKARASAAAARDQASANSAFDAKISKAGVGELFAMGDEFKSKGDVNRARIALRQLMSRFPDHKLAAEAAAMLTEMQGR